MVILLHFAVNTYGDYLYIKDQPFQEAVQNQPCLCDLIQDRFSLQTELEWDSLEECDRPKHPGCYLAVVQCLKAADATRMRVIYCIERGAFY